ncbi:hypothetical protein SASPL_137903 [Salvia splendens]|uniref:Uncharacterized protein n=1 Tax=Salvia splendens TaxID=180675 RepID=A0A8X8WVU6_SALSN|nr:hypothetical protein SASPL_137903 [Salvia splendens]
MKNEINNTEISVPNLRPALLTVSAEQLLRFLRVVPNLAALLRLLHVAARRNFGLNRGFVFSGGGVDLGAPYRRRIGTMLKTDFWLPRCILVYERSTAKRKTEAKTEPAKVIMHRKPPLKSNVEGRNVIKPNSSTADGNASADNLNKDKVAL